MKRFLSFFQENTIDPDTPVEVVNRKTGEVVWTGTYAKRNTARKVRDKRDEKYGSAIHTIKYPEGLKVLKEYRHNLADGSSKPSIQAHNGKNPNRLDKKNLHTVGPYQHKHKELHRPGKVMYGNKLLAMLADYNIDFEEGETAKIKNSPHGVKMFKNDNGQVSGKIIKLK